jgi:hypothetical protein
MTKLPLFLVLVAACAACDHPAPRAAAPAIDAGDLSARACANLAAMGCPEAADPAACTARVRDLVAGRMTTVDYGCVAGAVGQAGARACGVPCGQP